MGIVHQHHRSVSQDRARGAAGVGEPMLVKDLPRMIRYLKDRGVYVLFNTNGTLLTKANGQALIDAGLDELRVSLDAAESSVFQMVRGKDMFDRIVTNVGNFVAMQRANQSQLPRVSLWLTGLRETWRKSRPSFAWHISWG